MIDGIKVNKARWLSSIKRNSISVMKVSKTGIASTLLKYSSGVLAIILLQCICVETVLGTDGETPRLVVILSASL